MASVQAKPGCLFIAEGHDVILSNSRGPETLGDLVAELGEHSRAGTSTEAAQAADMVVVTVPLKAYRAVPVDPLAGKVVIDTNNYYPERDGGFMALSISHWSAIYTMPATGSTSGTQWACADSPRLLTGYRCVSRAVSPREIVPGRMTFACRPSSTSWVRPRVRSNGGSGRTSACG